MRDRLLGDLTSEPSPDPGTLALRARGAQEVDMGEGDVKRGQRLLLGGRLANWMTANRTTYVMW